MNTSSWNWKLINVVLLGAAFMMIFTAFQTTSMCSKLVTSSLKKEKITENGTEFWEEYKKVNYTSEQREKAIKEYKEKHEKTNKTDNDIVTYKIQDDIMNTRYGDGYLSMSLLYAIFSIANFCSAAIVKVCGHKMTMFVSGLTYLNYICMYLYPVPAYMYISSIIIGVGAACIWTAQGAFLHLQSPTDQLMSRNTGIFWCMLQLSLIFGNLYIYFAWGGKKYIDSSMRTTLFTGFGILAAAGCVVFLVLKKDTSDSSQEPKDDESKQQAKEELIEKTETSKLKTIWNSIIESFKLLATKEMLLITSLFMYSGFVLSFFSGVYPTAIGNSKLLENSISTVGLVGVFTGVGEVVGGGMFVFGSKIMDKMSRPILLICCLVVHVLAFGLVTINVPLTANMDSTEDKPCILSCILDKPTPSLAYATAFLLGLGDAGVNNVIYTTISNIWSKNSAPAFALMKCLQSAACAMSFAIASKINLLYNIGILIIFAFLTVGTYFPLMKSVKFSQEKNRKGSFRARANSNFPDEQ